MSKGEWKGIERLAEEITGEMTLDEQKALLRKRLEPLLDAAGNALLMATPYMKDFNLKKALRKELYAWR